MIICYYTENGKIYNCHTNRDKPYDELKSMADEWNSTEKTNKIHIVEVSDDSLTAYLMSRVTERKTYDKESISEIRDLLDELYDKIASLIRSE